MVRSAPLRDALLEEPRPGIRAPLPHVWSDDFPHPSCLGAEVVVPKPARHRHRVNDVVELPLSLRGTEGFVVGLGVLVHPEVRQLPARHLSQRQERVELHTRATPLLQASWRRAADQDRTRQRPRPQGRWRVRRRPAIEAPERSNIRVDHRATGCRSRPAARVGYGPN